MSIKTNELPQAAELVDSDSFVITTAQGTQKTPLSLLKGMFGKLFAPAPPINNIILYVNADTGSDSNDGLTEGTALRTVSKALGKLPKNLGGYNAEIWMAASSTAYSKFEVKDFYNGTLTIGLLPYGSEGMVTVSGDCEVTDCLAKVFFYKLKITGSKDDTQRQGVVTAWDALFLCAENCEIDGIDQTEDGIRVNFQSNVCAVNSTIKNCKVAVSTHSSSSSQRAAAFANVFNCTGENNLIGVQSSMGIAFISGVSQDSMGDVQYKKDVGLIVGANGELQ